MNSRESGISSGRRLGCSMDVTACVAAISPLATEGAAGRRLAKVIRSIAHADPCPDVVGMASVKKLRLLARAVSFLPPSDRECYFEVGSYQGKSLIAAIVHNHGRCAIACDNFSLFDDRGENRTVLERNLSRYGLRDRVRFFDCDFRDLLLRWRSEGLPPIGVYFYDGAHDEESQYLALRLGEAVLSERAVVIVDDWRFAEDSDSRAEAGTRRAVAESSNDWKVEYVLPARYNGDSEEWWNGVAVLSFRRRSALK